MMNTQERALEKAKSKVEELMWATPEGLTISEITGDLRISVALAKTALKAIGAVYEGGVWVLHDDDVAPVAAPAITDTSPAPVAQAAPSPDIKKMAQDIAAAHPIAPFDATAALGQYMPQMTNLVDSALAAPEQPVCTVCQTKTDIAPLSLTGECQGCYEDAMDKAWWDAAVGTLEVAPSKSDYARVIEVERETVLTVIQSGATLARVAELTGLHIDDAQHHVDVLIDLGRIVARPVVVAVAYEVVA